MKRAIMSVVLAGAVIASAAAQQQAQEITFFSNEGYSGTRFAVTGPRTTLDLTFQPRSASLRGGGTWELCPSRDYGGGCQRISASTRTMRATTVRSVRPVGAVAASGWREIARLNVRDGADRDLAAVRSSDMFREVRVCAERNPIRIRRAEVQLGNGTWQRLFVPAVLAPGKCSKNIDLTGDARRIRAVRFEYETLSAGIARGTIVVQALAQVEGQPR